MASPGHNALRWRPPSVASPTSQSMPLECSACVLNRTSFDETKAPHHRAMFSSDAPSVGDLASVPLLVGLQQVIIPCENVGLRVKGKGPETLALAAAVNG